MHEDDSLRNAEDQEKFTQETGLNPKIDFVAFNAYVANKLQAITQKLKTAMDDPASEPTPPPVGDPLAPPPEQVPGIPLE